MKENKLVNGLDVWGFMLNIGDTQLIIDGNESISVMEMEGCYDGGLEYEHSNNMLTIKELNDLLNSKKELYNEHQIIELKKEVSDEYERVIEDRVSSKSRAIITANEILKDDKAALTKQVLLLSEQLKTLRDTISIIGD